MGRRTATVSRSVQVLVGGAFPGLDLRDVTGAAEVRLLPAGARGRRGRSQEPPQPGGSTGHVLECGRSRGASSVSHDHSARRSRRDGDDHGGRGGWPRASTLRTPGTLAPRPLGTLSGCGGLQSLWKFEDGASRSAVGSARPAVGLACSRLCSWGGGRGQGRAGFPSPVCWWPRSSTNANVCWGQQSTRVRPSRRPRGVRVPCSGHPVELCSRIAGLGVLGLATRLHNCPLSIASSC